MLKVRSDRDRDSAPSARTTSARLPADRSGRDGFQTGSRFRVRLFSFGVGHKSSLDELGVNLNFTTWAVRLDFSRPGEPHPHHFLQRIHIRQIVQRLVNRRLGNEGRMRQPRIVQQSPKCLQPDASLPDVLMPVQLRSARGLGVVAMPDVNILQADGAIELIERVGKSFVADNVIACDVRVAGIDASSRGHELRQQVQQLGDLLEVAAEGKLRASSVLDEHAQVARRQVQTFDRLLNRQRGPPQTFFAAASAKRAGMQHQELRSQSQRALHFAAKGHDRLRMKFRVSARQVDQVIGMNGERLQVVALAQPAHLFALRAGQLVRLPLPRAGRENLKRIAAQAIGALGGARHAARRRSVNADAPRGELRRPLRRRQKLQDVFLLLLRILHADILERVRCYQTERLASARTISCGPRRLETRSSLARDLTSD
jgi:hypothetical protein